MKKTKLLKTLLIPTLGVSAIGVIAAVSTSCSPVVIVTGVSLNKESLTLGECDSDTLIANVHPENATDKSVTWSSSNSSVATVDNNGKVTAVSEGSAKITVKTNDGGYEDYCDVIVTEINFIKITANADSTLELINVGENNPNLQYSFDCSHWTTYSEKLKIPANEEMYLRGNNAAGWSFGIKNYSRFNITGNVSIYGNVMGLLDNGTRTISSIPNDYCFYDLFYDSTGITSVSKDFLPATTLTAYCYRYMFFNCYSLMNTPDLPAITLGECCYEGMFYECKSLTSAPALPATELAENCYDSMFKYCWSLKTVSALPATTLAIGCYSFMFYGCTSLTVAPDLPATTLAIRCYEEMFDNCNKLASVKIGYTKRVMDAPFFAFYNWMNNVAIAGYFYYNGSDTLANFGIPVTWRISPY